MSRIFHSLNPDFHLRPFRFPAFSVLRPTLYFRNSAKRRLRPFLLKYTALFAPGDSAACNFLFFSGGPREFRTFVFIYSFLAKEYPEMGEGGCAVSSTLQCEVCTGAGSRYFCRRAAGWGVRTMFIGYSLQATLEQINRKGLLQGRIEDVRVYSGQGMRRTCTLPPRWPHRCERILFNFTSLFFSGSLLLPPWLSFNDPRYGIRSFLDSELANSAGHAAFSRT